MDREQIAAKAAEAVHEAIAAAERRAEEIVEAAERRAQEIIAAAEGRAADAGEPTTERPGPTDPVPGEAAATPGAEPAGPGGAPDEMSAKIVALKMARDGASREEIVAELDERIPEADRARIADEMLTRARG